MGADSGRTVIRGERRSRARVPERLAPTSDRARSRAPAPERPLPLDRTMGASLFRIKEDVHGGGHR
jgi:hypothetical protein